MFMDELFVPERIKGLAKGELKPDMQISETSEGPWTPMSIKFAA